MKTVQVPVELLQQIVTYFSGCRWSDVDSMLQQIKQLSGQKLQGDPIEKDKVDD